MASETEDIEKDKKEGSGKSILELMVRSYLTNPFEKGEHIFLLND